MDAVINITYNKTNTIEFEAEIKGVDEKDAKAAFVIETKDVDLSFKAVRSDNKWIVTVPPIALLEKTAYNFRICMVVDGYFFEPSKGTLNVVGTAEVYTTKVKNTSLSSTVQGEKKEDDPEQKEDKEVKEHHSSLGLKRDTLAQSFLKEFAKERKPTAASTTDPVRPTAAEQLARKILAEHQDDVPMREKPTPRGQKDDQVLQILHALDKTSKRGVAFTRG